MAGLENGSYDEIVAHLERDLGLNALEESDVLPMASMTFSTSRPKTLLSTKTLLSASDRHRLQLLQGKGPYGRRLQETEQEERCPTRQTYSEEDISQIRDLWQD